MKRPVGITMGDACGIGPEIIARVFADGLPAPAVVIGDPMVMERAVQQLGISLDVQSLASLDDRLPTGPVIPVLNVSNLPSDIPIGQVDGRAGRASYDYIVRAIDEALSGRLSAIVTAPINKEAMKKGGLNYPGHTEIFAERSGTDNFAMMLANDELRVILVTIHVSLRDAIEQVTQESVLRTIKLAHRAGKAYGLAIPRVAVAGLNPHAGENGMFGREDLDIIAPAIARAQSHGIDASGPWPGDTIFMRARRGEFDIVVAQYHDQGLIPVKFLGIDNGVNVTIGLPFIRTSVDHGTAFDIAGRGKADHSSLRYAFDQALLFNVQ